jgi:hypothetical protein
MSKKAVAVNERQEVTLGNGEGSVAYFRGPNSEENPITAGEEITGNYLGSFKAGSKIKSLVHKVELADGNVVGINGSGMLNKKLEKTTVGSNITILYEGKKEITSGEWTGTNAHQYKVFLNTPGGVSL